MCDMLSMTIYGLGVGRRAQHSNNTTHQSIQALYRICVSTEMKPGFVTTQNESGIHFPSPLTLVVPPLRIHSCFKICDEN
jgi:hypothetical protein